MRWTRAGPRGSRHVAAGRGCGKPSERIQVWGGFAQRRRCEAVSASESKRGAMAASQRMPSCSWRLGAVAVLGALAFGLVGVGEADARKASRLERAAMLKAWRSQEGFAAEPRRCWNTFVTRIARARPRTGAIWMNIAFRKRRRCSLADGYAIMRRPTRKSTRWRVVWQGSDEPPCRLMTTKMVREMALARWGLPRRCRR